MILKRVWFVLGLVVIQASAEIFVSEIYPFANGVNFGNAEEGVQALKELGYDGIGSVYPNKLAEYKKACEKSGLKIFSIYVGGKVNGDGFEYSKDVSEAIEILKGTDAVVELYVERGREATDAQAVAFVREVADKAKVAGLKVVLYPHLDFFIERVDHAVVIAKATERDHVGVAFNLCHYLKVEGGEGLREVLMNAKPYLWSVSICGADKGGKNWGELIRPLDEGSFDQLGLLRLLKEIGYEGPVGLQCFGIRLPSSEHLGRSMGEWKGLQKLIK